MLRRTRSVLPAAAAALLAAAIPGLFTAGSLAQAQSPAPPPDETAFRALYKQLVEINTTRSVGGCTEAAEAMRAHLLAAGIPAADARVLAPPGGELDQN